MGRLAALVYGVAAYALFFGTFLWLIGFVGNVAVPKSIDSGGAAGRGAALFVDLALVALFGIQHSVMARPGFKRHWTRLVPAPIERSTYVAVSSLVLLLVMWQWRPLGDVVWSVDHPAARYALLGVFWLGWGVVLWSSFLIDHFDLFGLRQVFLYWRGAEYTHPEFTVRSLYRFVRNPLMLGMLLGIWAAPTMTEGHLLFSVAMTAYAVVGIRLEERDHLRTLGDAYREYRDATPMIVPGLRRGRSR